MSCLELLEFWNFAPQIKASIYWEAACARHRPSLISTAMEGGGITVPCYRWENQSPEIIGNNHTASKVQKEGGQISELMIFPHSRLRTTKIHLIHLHTITVQQCFCIRDGSCPLWGQKYYFLLYPQALRLPSQIPLNSITKPEIFCTVLPT